MSAKDTKLNKLMIENVLPQVAKIIKEAAKTIANSDDPFLVDDACTLIINELAGFLILAEYPRNDGMPHLHITQMTDDYFKA